MTGAALDDARRLLAECPVELLRGVCRRDADEAVKKLREVGADAEALGPDDLRPR